MKLLQRVLDPELRRGLRTWLPLGFMALLCTFLAVLQYRWIGEISVAEHERLKTGLEASLNRLARDLNFDISSSIAALMPSIDPDSDEEPVEQAYSEAYAEWSESTRHAALFARLAIAIPRPADGSGLALKLIDKNSKLFKDADWPAEWLPLKQFLASPRRGGGGGFFQQRPGGSGPPSGFVGLSNGPLGGSGSLIILPRFSRPEGPRPDDMGPGPSRPREREWLLVEVNPEYVGTQILPELMDRHLGQSQYEFALASRTQPSRTLFQTSSSALPPDGSIGLLDFSPEVLFRRFSRGMPGRPEGASPRRRGPGPSPMTFGPPPGPEPRGRWILSVRNKAGSLDAIIAQARWRNLGLSAAILALLVATAGALIRYSRQAEKLAQLQMEFVASISHELRTPLTVIRMAAYNLKGRIAQNPPQVERYGSLIQQESERLTSIVEQVLRFASLESGKASVSQTPVAVNDLLTHTMESCRPVMEHAHCEVEQQITAGLPVVLGDTIALQHALQNLITNAVKYGTESSNWIGIFAEEVGAAEARCIEIRVADRGPGIPEAEQAHIFDPFFRGRRAMEDQIHGTGLGLNLVKKIIEAHGGSVAVKSAAGQGTEFIVRLPVAPAEYQDEFAHTFG